MKKYILGLVSLTISGFVQAQIPEDALKFSWQVPQGTARIQAIGGAVGALGGDISSLYVNPAGLGFYKTAEFVLSPGLGVVNNIKGNYYNTESKITGDNVLTLGPTGVVIGNGPTRYKNRNSALAIAINRTANFNNRTYYSGLNNVSSMSEQFAEELSRSGMNIDDILNENSAYPFSVAPALYTYLIDVDANTNQVVTATDALLDGGTGLRQLYDRKTTGGVVEITPGFAGNTDDKWYYGGSIGVSLINYESNLNYTETDESGKTDNGFASFNYMDNFSTKGFGINARLGVIYRPQEHLRFGLALNSPTYMQLEDNRSTEFQTRLENPVESFTVNSSMFNNNFVGFAKYMQGTAFKAVLSGAYVFREVEDVTQQKGFISADLEYATHNSSRFWSAAEQPTPDDKAYYRELGDVIKDIYKGAVNARLGGELKFNTLMARAGFAYYGNPYKDVNFKANQMNLSGGLGYRNKGFFADISYVHRMMKDGQFPYLLTGQPNNAAILNQTNGSVALTLGFKF